MFNHVSMKNPVEVETLGEHRARKAGAGSLNTPEPTIRRPSTSSSGSALSNSSNEWTALKIIVTRSFGVASSKMERPISPATANFSLQESSTSESGQEDGTRSPPLQDHTFKASEVECAYDPEAMYFIRRALMSRLRPETPRYEEP